MKKKTALFLALFTVVICLPFFVTIGITGIHIEKNKRNETEAVAVVTVPSETAETTEVVYEPSVRTISYVKEEAVHILRKKYGEIYFENGLDNAFQIIERDSKGNVVEVMVGSAIMSGEQFAEIMKIGSLNFKIKINSTDIIFTVINE